MGASTHRFDDHAREACRRTARQTSGMCIAAAMVTAPQRGVLVGRRMHDKMFDLEGSVMHDMCRETLPLFCLISMWTAVHVQSHAALAHSSCVSDLGKGQGCPVSRTLFALTFDPLARRCTSTVTRASLRLCAFVDDIGLAMQRLATQMRGILS